MDFYEEIASRGFTSFIRSIPYKAPTYHGWEKVKSFLLDLVYNKKTVYIEGDYDVDGLCCSLICQETMKNLGIEHTVYKYHKRTHSMDSVAVHQCIQGHYDYFIVADTGSSDMGLLDMLTKYGVKVIVLDHHITDFMYDDFNENIAVINTEIENKMGADFQLSAGALCFTVMDLLYRALGLQTPPQLATYALVSLYADVICMKNELNRGIYSLATSIPEEQLPPYVTYFKGEYSRFNARYIGYWFSPRINACFRAEDFEPLNLLFFSEPDAVTRSKLLNRVEAIYTNSRDMVKAVSDALMSSCFQLDHFIFANLNSIKQYYDIEDNKLYNYTGLIANNLAHAFSKTTIVICEQEGALKGSLRDFYGRDYLKLFKTICQAGGHGAAFGFHLNLLDFDSFVDDLGTIDRYFSIEDIDNSPIVIDIGDGEAPDVAMLRDIATYNEFSSPGVPVCLIKKRIIGDIRERKTPYNYKYCWGDMELQSDNKIPFGSYIHAKPIWSWKLKLLCE